ncbi:hypothetical protein AVEN_258127-1, partial [Araneus ventricosus]
MVDEQLECEDIELEVVEVVVLNCSSAEWEPKQRGTWRGPFK